MRFDVAALIGAALGTISVFLPWWTLDIAQSGLSQKWLLYLYQTTLTVYFAVPEVNFAEAEWYGLVALVLVAAGVALEFAGSFPRFRNALYAGLILVASGVVFFTLGLVSRGYALYSLSGSGETVYTEYVTYGYWLALASFVVPSVVRLLVGRKSVPQQEEVQVPKD